MFIFMAGVVLVCYLLGVLISQPEISLGMNGMLTKLSGETVCALMSLLGANIMPHNFYLHSSIVQVSLSFSSLYLFHHFSSFKLFVVLFIFCFLKFFLCNMKALILIDYFYNHISR